MHSKITGNEDNLTIESWNFKHITTTYTGRNFEDFFITANALPRHPERCQKEIQLYLSHILRERKKNEVRMPNSKFPSSTKYFFWMHISATQYVKNFWVGIYQLQTWAKSHPTNQSISLLWLATTRACSLPENFHNIIW